MATCDGTPIRDKQSYDLGFEAGKKESVSATLKAVGEWLTTKYTGLYEEAMDERDAENPYWTSVMNKEHTDFWLGYANAYSDILQTSNVLLEGKPPEGMKL